MNRDHVAVLAIVLCMEAPAPQDSCSWMSAMLLVGLLVLTWTSIMHDLRRPR